MALPPARVSIDIVWRSNPARFVVSFYDSTLILLEDGNRLVADCYVAKGESAKRSMAEYGPWRLKGEHENFVNCMMMANVHRERAA